MTPLNLVKSFITNHIIEADMRYRFNWARIGAIIFAIAAGLVFLQTELLVSMCRRPEGMEGIKRDMASDRAAQDERHNWYIHQGKEPPPAGIEPHDRLRSDEKRMLEVAIPFLRDDEALQNNLQETFGASFKDLNAVVIPEREMTELIHQTLGITTEGIRDAYAQEPWGFQVGGLTVRDRGGLAQATFDGRPRIALNPWSFKSQKALRSALFHEMLHALNVPGYTPLCVRRPGRRPLCAVLAQNDLVYLREYRAFRERAELKGFHDKGIYLVLVGLLVLFIGCVRRLLIIGPQLDAIPRTN